MTPPPLFVSRHDPFPRLGEERGCSEKQKDDDGYLMKTNHERGIERELSLLTPSITDFCQEILSASPSQDFPSHAGLVFIHSVVSTSADHTE